MPQDGTGQMLHKTRLRNERPMPIKPEMRYVYTFLIMMGFWILLSGRFDAFHITLGVLSSILVSFMSGDLFISDLSRKGRLGEFWRFLLFLPWILKEIFLAATQVAATAIRPGTVRIDPKVIRFKTKLKREISRTVFANAITLTPGTITIRITEDEYLVHALSSRAAEGLPGEMEARIGRIFGEG